MPPSGLIYASLINTLVGGKTKCQPDTLLKSICIVFADKRDRCLCCKRLEECAKRSCHVVSLYPLSYRFPLKKARTVFTGKAKVHYLPVLGYLGVIEVEKSAGLR